MGFNDKFDVGGEKVWQAGTEVNSVEDYQFVVLPHCDGRVGTEDEELVAVGKSFQLQQAHLFELNLFHSHCLFAAQLECHYVRHLLPLHHSQQNLGLLSVKQEFEVFTLRVIAHCEAAQQLPVLHLPLLNSPC